VTKVEGMSAWCGTLVCLTIWASAASPTLAEQFVIRLSPPSAPTDAAPMIEAAVAKARRARGSGTSQTRIEFAEGTFHLHRPVRLTVGDGGRWGEPLVVAGAGIGRTRLLGSLPLARYTGDWSALRDALPVAARQVVQVFHLPPELLLPQRAGGVRRFHVKSPGEVPLEVFDERGVLRPARWPNTGWANARAGKSRESLLLDATALSRWHNESDLWLSGYIGHDWSFETLPVALIDSRNGQLGLSRPPHYAPAPNNRVVVEHALAELDAPGEWYADRDRRILLVWPRAGAGTVSVSVATRLFTLERTEHVRLQGFSGFHTREDAIRVEGGADIGISDVEIRWVAGRAVHIEDAPASHVIRSRLSELGEGGIFLAAGDRRALRAGNLLAAENRIERYARLGRTYKAAIELRGVGNKAVGNYIAHAPHMAIYIHGNDHHIDLNEIAYVVADTTDAGAIYTGRDVTAQGNRITRNFLRDIRASRRASGFEVKGIYLDDYASGFEVTGNVFLRVDQPVFIGGGRDNTVARNLFVAASPAIHIDARGMSWSASAISDPRSALRRAFAAMPVDAPHWRARYARLPAFLADDAAEPKRNLVDANIAVASDGLRLEEGVDAAKQDLRSPFEVTAGAMGSEPAANARTASELLEHLPLGVRTAGALARIPFGDLDRNRHLPSVE
jgi:hypothetical protein